MGAYGRNRQQAKLRATESDEVGQAVRELLARKGEWQGTATQLLSELRSAFDDDRRRLPVAGHSLSNRLRRVAPDLRALGYTIVFDRVGHESRKMITLRAPDNSVGSDGSAREVSSREAA
jgi:hypothetical protein